MGGLFRGLAGQLQGALDALRHEVEDGAPLHGDRRARGASGRRPGHGRADSSPTIPSIGRPARGREIVIGAGLVTRGKDAQRRPARLEAAPLAEATGWLEEYRKFWEVRFRTLDALLDEMKSLQQRPPHPSRRPRRSQARSRRRKP